MCSSKFITINYQAQSMVH